MAEEMLGSNLVFVGERPSEKAAKQGLRWEDGGLAAKQLFDALRANGVDPALCGFVNLFGQRHDRDADPRYVGRVANTLKKRTGNGDFVIGMGAKVCDELKRRGVPHIKIIHPAARGSIRRKDRYEEHVRSALRSVSMAYVFGA